MRQLILPVIVLLWLAGGAAAAAQIGYTPVPQTNSLARQENEVVYRTNLERATRGIPPLRWNWQLTQSTRWFAADKSAAPDCENAHRDTLGNYPDARADAFGYPGSAGAENVWCVYVEPQPAVEGWINSPTGHAENLLSPDHREVGVGYSQNGEGWLAQDFGSDPAYSPLVIDNEALNTTGSQVNLYIYNRPGGEFFTSLQPAETMQISEDACFNNAAVQPYQTRITAPLSPGEGWKRIYARTRDAYGRSLTVEDSIYRGAPPADLALDESLFSNSRASVSLHQLDAQGRSHIQLSLGWLGDAFKTGRNTLLAQAADPGAMNGRAVSLPHNRGDGSDPNMIWTWTTSFIENAPMVAYFRVKTSALDGGEIARLSVTAGRNQSGEIILRAADFPAAGAYIEVPVAFTFQPDSSNPFLIFRIRRSGSALVSADVVTIFTAPQRFTGSPFTWQMPGGAYRGQGVWARFSSFDGSNFTPLREAAVAQKDACLSPASLTVMKSKSAPGGAPPHSARVIPSFISGDNWSVSENLPWLQAARRGEKVELTIETGSLNLGDYNGEVLIHPGGDSAPLRLTVRLLVVEEVHPLYLPAVSR
ncbi:MAG: CAP domain-containing protein [Bellilinea sp.]|jgi:hypothetical protein